MLFLLIFQEACLYVSVQSWPGGSTISWVFQDLSFCSTLTDMRLTSLQLPHGYKVGAVIRLHRGRKENIRKWGWFACVKGTLSVQNQIIMSNSKPRMYMNTQWQCSKQYCESARNEESQTGYPRQTTSRFCDNHQHFHSSRFLFSCFLCTFSLGYTSYHLDELLSL